MKNMGKKKKTILTLVTKIRALELTFRTQQQDLGGKIVP